MRELRDIKLSLELAHKLAMKEAMFITDMNISKLAGGLGISRATAYKYLTKYFGKNFHKVLAKEFMVPTNTAEDIIKLTKEE